MFRLCFGKSVESYDGLTPRHLKSGKINLPPDVIDAARMSKADNVDAAVQKILFHCSKHRNMKQ